MNNKNVTSEVIQDIQDKAIKRESYTNTKKALDKFEQEKKKALYELMKNETIGDLGGILKELIDNNFNKNQIKVVMGIFKKFPLKMYTKNLTLDVKDIIKINVNCTDVVSKNLDDIYKYDFNVESNSIDNNLLKDVKSVKIVLDKDNVKPLELDIKYNIHNLIKEKGEA